MLLIKQMALHLNYKVPINFGNFTFVLQVHSFANIFTLL